jgi:hypothetical protein
MRTYSEIAEMEEWQEHFNLCVKAAVAVEVRAIIDNATCFDCDNPLTVLRTEDGGIAVKECEKCHGSHDAIPEIEAWSETIDRINTLTRQINGGTR